MGIACDRATVAAAVAAASPGDTIELNAGTETWSSAITLDKNLNIVGSGVDATVITDNGFASSGIDSFKISYIGWVGTTAVPIQFYDCQGWRLHHCKFTGMTVDTIRPYSASWGLVDNCDFYNCNNGFTFTGNDDTDWESVGGFGGPNFCFVEDCNFYVVTKGSAHFVQAGYGARYVIRYCNIYEGDSYRLDSWFDSHGAGNIVNGRGVRAFEFYHNTLKRGLVGTYSVGFNLRGGTGLVHDNIYDESSGKKLSDAGGAYIRLMEYRCTTDLTANPPLAGANDRCPVGVGGEGYPCIDQIGRGKFTAIGNQDSEPLYIWGNEDHLGNPINTVSCAAPHSTYIQSGRDYFNDGTELSGYTPYTYPHPLQGEPEAIDSALWGDWSYAQFPFEVVKPSRHISVFF